MQRRTPSYSRGTLSWFGDAAAAAAVDAVGDDGSCRRRWPGSVEARCPLLHRMEDGLSSSDSVLEEEEAEDRLTEERS